MGKWTRVVRLIYKSPIYQGWALTVALLVAFCLIVFVLWGCGHYEYHEEHCIVTEKGVRPRLVGNGPNYWIMLTCPNVYHARPWAEDLPYDEWAHINANDQRTVTVRVYK